MNNTIYQVSIDPGNELILYNPTVYQYTIPANLITFLLVKIKLTVFAVNLDEVRMDSLDLDTERIKR